MTEPGAGRVSEVVRNLPTLDDVSSVEIRTAETDTAMRELGRELAKRFRPGDVIVLTGPLGAGKTTLTQGIGSGLGVRGPITSPTFALARRHPSLVGGVALVHVDAYRLSDADELEDLDLEATMPDSVTIVEWGEDVADYLGAERLEVSIVRHSDDTRTVTLTGVGSRWVDIPATRGR